MPLDDYRQNILLILWTWVFAGRTFVSNDIKAKVSHMDFFIMKNPCNPESINSHRFIKIIIRYNPTTKNKSIVAFAVNASSLSSIHAFSSKNILTFLLILLIPCILPLKRLLGMGGLLFDWPEFKMATVTYLPSESSHYSLKTPSAPLWLTSMTLWFKNKNKKMWRLCVYVFVCVCVKHLLSTYN